MEVLKERPIILGSVKKKKRFCAYASHSDDDHRNEAPMTHERLTHGMSVTVCTGGPRLNESAIAEKDT